MLRLVSPKGRRSLVGARRSTILASLAALSGALVLAATAGASPAAGASQWHRNNYGNEHERLTCREASSSWTCRYDKVADEGLPVDGRIGTFSGRNVTATWSCPDWFEATVCDNVVVVYQGVATYTGAGAHPAKVVQEYIVTAGRRAGHARMVVGRV